MDRLLNRPEAIEDGLCVTIGFSSTVRLLAFWKKSSVLTMCSTSVHVAPIPKIAGISVLPTLVGTAMLAEKK